jgi:hypothetical protein
MHEMLSALFKDSFIPNSTEVWETVNHCVRSMLILNHRAMSKFSPSLWIRVGIEKRSSPPLPYQVG